MNNITFFLKQTLETDKLTCVISDGNDFIYKSDLRGIKPLYDFIEKSPGHGPYFIADRVIGKAAALLCVKAGIREAYADVMSFAAIEIFENNGIPCFYENKVPQIMNRTKTGLCPMENLSSGIDNPDEMFEKINLWLKSMQPS